MVYHLTGVEYSVGFFETFDAINTMSGGYYILILIVVALYIILLLNMRRAVDDTKDLFLAVNTIMGFVSLGLWALQLINTTVLTVIIVLWLISLLVKIFGGE